MEIEEVGSSEPLVTEGPVLESRSTRTDEELPLRILQVSECCIYKVHSHLRNVNAKEYDPALISIGPYHHGKPELCEMEKYKTHYLELLLGYTDADDITEIEEGRNSTVLDCYLDTFHHIGLKAFRKMLLLDACFIIQFFTILDDSSCDSTRQSDRMDDPVINLKWMRQLIKRDLLLFENQLPLFVLRKLFSLTISYQNLFLKGQLSASEKKEPVSIAKQLPLGKRKVLLSIAGQLSPSEREELLSIASQLSLSELKEFYSIAGRLSSGERKVLISMARQLSLNKQKELVSIAGQLPPSVLKEFYSIASRIRLSSGERKVLISVAGQLPPGEQEKLLIIASQLSLSAQKEFLSIAGQLSSSEQKEFLSFVSQIRPSVRETFLSNTSQSSPKQVIDIVRDLQRNESKVLLHRIADELPPSEQEEFLSTVCQLPTGEQTELIVIAVQLSPGERKELLSIARQLPPGEQKVLFYIAGQLPVGEREQLLSIAGQLPLGEREKLLSIAGQLSLGERKVLLSMASHLSLGEQKVLLSIAGQLSTTELKDLLSIADQSSPREQKVLLSIAGELSAILSPDERKVLLSIVGQLSSIERNELISLAHQLSPSERKELLCKASQLSPSERKEFLYKAGQLSPSEREKLISTKGQGQNSDCLEFDRLALKFFGLNGKLIDRYINRNKSNDVPHLLGLVYTALVLSGKDAEEEKVKCRCRISYVPLFLLVLLSRALRHCYECLRKKPSGQYKFIRSAKALHDVGIGIRVVDDDSFVIKFDNGELFIPKLRIDDCTESFFRSLVAYEQYSKNYQFHVVADYLLFMDCLINCSTDVELLRHAGIIDNRLGDDEKVATMFNRLCSSLYFEEKDFFYDKVFCDINEYCESRLNVWMADLWHRYFNSPWSLISFIAAVILLILTALQTVYTMRG